MITGTSAPRWKLTRMPRCGIEHADVLFAAFDRLCTALEYELPALPFGLRLKVSRILYACTAQAAVMSIGVFSFEESPERVAAAIMEQDGGFARQEVIMFAESGILGDGKKVFAHRLGSNLDQVREEAREDAAYEVCRSAAEGRAPSTGYDTEADFVAGWADKVKAALKLLPGGPKHRQTAAAADDFLRLSAAVYIGAGGVLARRDILDSYARRRRIPLEAACAEMDAWERDGLFGRAQYREIAAAHYGVVGEREDLLEEVWLSEMANFYIGKAHQAGLLGAGVAGFEADGLEM